MNKRIEYKFDSNTRILFKYHFGTINFNDIETSWIDAFNNNTIPENVIGFVLDYSEAELDMVAEEAKDITRFYREHLDVFRNRKVALVMTKPGHVVFPILVGMEADEYFTRAFYTTDAAVEWVLH